MDRLLSERAVLDAIEKTKTARSENNELYVGKINAQMAIMQLPSAEPHSIKVNQGQSSDMISRQAAIDAIEKTKTARSEDNELYVAKINAEMNIMQLPFAEPQIIRCKDCKHYKFSDNRAFGFPVKRCEWTGFEDVDDDDFCSFAERRTE